MLYCKKRSNEMENGNDACETMYHFELAIEKCVAQVKIDGLLDAKIKPPHWDQFIFEDNSLVPY